jgi:hypothetical protein
VRTGARILGACSHGLDLTQELFEHLEAFPKLTGIRRSGSIGARLIVKPR